MANLEEFNPPYVGTILADVLGCDEDHDAYLVTIDTVAELGPLTFLVPAVSAVVNPAGDWDYEDIDYETAYESWEG